MKELRALKLKTPRRALPDAEKEDPLNPAGRDEIDVTFGGAWDWPLSKTEKVKKVIDLFAMDAEMRAGPLEAQVKELEVRVRELSLENSELRAKLGMSPSQPQDKPQVAARHSAGSSGRSSEYTEDFREEDEDDDLQDAAPTVGVPATGVAGLAPHPSSQSTASDAALRALQGPGSCATITTPCFTPRVSGVSCLFTPRTGPVESCVASVIWASDSQVFWVSFEFRDQGVGQRFGPPGGQGAADTGKFELRPTEYIQVLRGCQVKSANPSRLAEWIVVGTSELRSAILGSPARSGGQGQQPSFSFVASAGHELCGLTLDEEGTINGAVQRPLQPEAKEACARGSSSGWMSAREMPRSGWMSARGPVAQQTPRSGLMSARGPLAQQTPRRLPTAYEGIQHTHGRRQSRA